MFGFDGAALPVDKTVRRAFRAEWQRLASAGTWFRGSERVAIAAEARAARSLASAGTDLSPPVVEAAQSISAAAQYVTRDWVEDLVARGVTLEQYVEVIGVVSRLAAVDGYCRGVGADLEPLPEPVPGDPSHERSDDAVLREAFVPTVSEDRAREALSAVPAEEDARRALSDALYLPDDAVGQDLTYQGVLSRPQMELLAARVSHLNDCSY